MITKVITLTHGTLKDTEGKPKKIKVVSGPGFTFFRSNEKPVTWLACTGGAVEVVETEEEITKLITANPQEGNNNGI